MAGQTGSVVRSNTPRRPISTWATRLPRELKQAEWYTTACVSESRAADLNGLASHSSRSAAVRSMLEHCDVRGRVRRQNLPALRPSLPKHRCFEGRTDRAQRLRLRPDLQHSTTESRCRRMGRSIEGRVLIVVYTRRSNGGAETIRLSSARRASRTEREAYASED